METAVVPTKNEQRAAAGGLLFVTLAVVWGIIAAHAPDAATPAARIDAYFFDRAQRAHLVLAGWALAFAGIGLLVFAAALRSWLRRVDGTSALPAIVFGAAIVLVATLFAKNAVLTAAAAVYDDAPYFRLDAGVYKVLRTIASWLLAEEVMTGGVMAAAVSHVAVRTRVLPRALAWAGFGVAALCLLAIPFRAVASIALLAWILAVSLLMFSPPRGSRVTRASGS